MATETGGQTNEQTSMCNNQTTTQRTSHLAHHYSGAAASIEISPHTFGQIAGLLASVLLGNLLLWWLVGSPVTGGIKKWNGLRFSFALRASILGGDGGGVLHDGARDCLLYVVPLFDSIFSSVFASIIKCAEVFLCQT